MGHNGNHRNRGMPDCALPDELDHIRVFGEGRVRGEEAKWTGERLGDKQSVEWIGMNRRQACHHARMSSGYRKFGKAADSNAADHIGNFSLKFSEADFDGDFPNRRCTDKDRIGLRNLVSSPSWHAWGIDQIPQINMRIQQQGHASSPSKWLSTSSGSGASKSSEIRMRPRKKPGVREGRIGVTGTRRASLGNRDFFTLKHAIKQA